MVTINQVIYVRPMYGVSSKNITNIENISRYDESLEINLSPRSFCLRNEDLNVATKVGGCN